MSWGKKQVTYRLKYLQNTIPSILLLNDAKLQDFTSLTYVV